MNRSKGKASPKTSTTVVVASSQRTRQAPKKKSKGPRQQKRVSKGGRTNAASPNNPLNHPVTQDYYKSLVDPFEFTGPRLGWGCMVPSTVNTMYLRTTATANADGTLAVIAFPNPGALGYTYASGATTAGITAVLTATDAATVESNYSSGRTISLGIRAFPLIAATDKNPITYFGALTEASTTLLQTFTPTDFLSFPTTKVALGAGGASCTGRPIDPESFIFAGNTTTSSVSSAYTPSFSLPYIGFSGLPASAVVSIEIAHNFEGLAAFAHSNASLNTSNSGQEGTLASVWGTIERMWGSIQNRLPPPGRPGQSASVYDAVGNGLLALGAGALRSRLGGDSQFGRGQLRLM